MLHHTSYDLPFRLAQKMTVIELENRCECSATENAAANKAAYEARLAEKGLLLNGRHFEGHAAENGAKYSVLMWR